VVTFKEKLSAAVSTFNSGHLGMTFLSSAYPVPPGKTIYLLIGMRLDFMQAGSQLTLAL